MRILVADASPLLRRGIREVLCEQADLVVAGEAGDAAALAVLLAQGPWDVAVVDLALPGAHRLELVRRLVEERPGLPLLSLAGRSEERFAVAALRAGAAGCVDKRCSPHDLVRAVRRAIGGGRYMSERLAERLLESAEESPRRLPHEALSPREFQVLLALGAGRKVGEIAGQLGLSPKTVSTYRTRLLGKMGLSSNAELTRYVVEQGLDPPDG